MARTDFEIASVIKRYGAEFRMQHHPNNYQLTVLNALRQCRSAELGGHKDKCDSCGEEHFSYNSCGNRHCPKCQVAKQMLWAEDRMRDSLNVKHFHVVFTVPDELNPICLADSLFFYKSLFACVKKPCVLSVTHITAWKQALSVCSIPGGKT